MESAERAESVETSVRRIGVAFGLAVCLGATLFAPTPVRAASGARAASESARLECEIMALDSQFLQLCSGDVPSEDGSAALDIDVTVPVFGERPSPLVVLLHGFGGSKKSLESRTVEGSQDAFHMNNLWFASRGYAVLNYTARGMGGSKGCLDDADPLRSVDGRTLAGVAASKYGISRACESQLAHRRYEIEDTQHLIGRLVDGSLVDGVAVSPRRVGVVGVSYGGGQAWLLSRLNQWRSPEGRRVRLAATVPIAGWSDLADALIPNGRTRDDRLQPASVAERRAEVPGVLRGALSQLGVVSSQGPPASYLESWVDRLGEGEPYATDPIVADALDKLLRQRSAFYVPRTSRYQTPVLAIQGFSDGLFPASQTLRMHQRLTGADPMYPIGAYLGGVGHAPAQSDAGERAYVASRANRFLDFYLRAKGRQPGSQVEARIQTCDAQLGALYRSNDWGGLQGADLEPGLDMNGALASPTNDPHAAELDPAQAGRGCVTTPVTTAEGNLAETAAVPAEGFTMLGMPQVTLVADPSPDLSAIETYVAARLWDVDRRGTDDTSDDTQVLVDRGVYRLGSDHPQTIVFQLFGNAYRFEPGHEIKLELTADDSPTFRRWGPGPSDEAVLDVSDVSLELPSADPSALVAP